MPDIPAHHALASSAMSRLLKESRVLIAVGSGGVGKTTTAAALAVMGARQGQKVALLTIDPARRLAQALGLAELGNTAQPLAQALVSPGEVDAMQLDVSETFDDLITRLVEDPVRRQRLLENRLYQVLAYSLGGTQEYMAVERLYSLATGGGYDLVIVDTPPTVNALNFIDAPQRLATFFSDRITRFLTRPEDRQAGIFTFIKDKAGDLALGLLAKALGTVFVEDLVEFTGAFQSLFSEFRKRGEAIHRLLRLPGTAFVVVTGADPLRVAEALSFVEELKRLQINPRAWVVNRVHMPPSKDSEISAEAIGAMLSESKYEAWVGDDPNVRQEMVESLGYARRVRQLLGERAARGLAELAKAVGGERLLIIPEMEEEIVEARCVERFVAFLSGEQPAWTRVPTP